MVEILFLLVILHAALVGGEAAAALVWALWKGKR
jgi:hypothetical protein